MSKYPEQFLRFPPDSDFLVIRPRDCIRIVKTLSWSTQTWRVVLTIDNWGELVVEVIVNKVVDETRRWTRRWTGRWTKKMVMTSQ